MLYLVILSCLALCHLSSAVGWRIYGINYSPRTGATWDPAACKSQEEINNDLKILKRITDRVRIYSFYDCNAAEMVLSAAKLHDMSVWVGMWVDSNPRSFMNELHTLEGLLKSGKFDSDRIDGLHVGSEGLYRSDYVSSYIIDCLGETKSLLQQYNVNANFPVTTADVGDAYHANHDVMKAVDVVSMNTFPFWERTFIWFAKANVRDKLKRMIHQAAKYNKKVVLGETGWASKGWKVNAPFAGEGNQAKFLEDFVCLMQEFPDVPYYYFSAFDEPWKAIGEDDGFFNKPVESSFGIHDEYGNMKPKLQKLQFKCLRSLRTSEHSR